MYEYIQGKLDSIEPTQAVIECGGVGFLLEISLNTYQKISDKAGQCVRLYSHFVVREDAQQLYGFADKEEREMFRRLTSVNGVGNQTARMILSSMTVEQLTAAIGTQDVRQIQKVKGIGAKTAQRIVLDLADKIDSVGGSVMALSANHAIEEALSALQMLGYAKPNIEKFLSSSSWKKDDGGDMSVEDIIKIALQKL